MCSSDLLAVAFEDMQEVPVTSTTHVPALTPAQQAKLTNPPWVVAHFSMLAAGVAMIIALALYLHPWAHHPSNAALGNALDSHHRMDAQLKFNSQLPLSVNPFG